MKKKWRLVGCIIMLVVLIAGIVCVIHANNGNAIYSDAADVMGTDRKMAMTYIQSPDKLTELGKISKAGADNIKRFLKNLNSWFLSYEDSVAYSTAVDEVAAYETATADSQDREKMLNWAIEKGTGIGRETYDDLAGQPDRLASLEKEMALSLIGITAEELDSDQAILDAAGNQSSFEEVMQELEAYEAARKDAKDKAKFLAWAEENGTGYTEEIYTQVAADKGSLEMLEEEMALSVTGITVDRLRYDNAFKTITDFSAALEETKDRDKFVEWAEKNAKGIAREKYDDVEKDADRLSQLRKDMILDMSGVTEEKLAADRDLIAHAFDADKKAPFEAAVDAAVDARAKYEDAAANAKDKARFLEWAQANLKGVAEENYADLIKDPEREAALRKEMALSLAGLTEDDLAAAQELVAAGDQSGQAAYDDALAKVNAFESAEAEAKDVNAFLEWTEANGKGVAKQNYKGLVKDRTRLEALRAEMIMEELGISQEEYDKVSSNSELLGLFKGNISKLLDNQHMTSAVIFQFIGIILIVAALAFFLIQAMDIKPRQRVRAANPKAAKVTSFLLNYALFIIMGLILVIVSIINVKFLDVTNILNILQNASTKGILALGCAGLIVLAGTDLSIGRVLGISAAVTASLVQLTSYTSRMYPTMIAPLGSFGLLLPLFASIAVAVAFCMLNGFGVAKLHLHAFIVTLGTQLIAYGANCLYIESQPSGTAQALSTFDPNFLNIAAGAIRIGEVRIPIVVLYFLALAFIVWVIWNKTKLGKNMFAVGGNTEAAAVSGVNVAKTIMLVYLMAGVLYGIASFLEAARITSVGANTGLNYETDAISAVVVGGVSFSGGVGTIQGVVIGAVILQAIVYALQFLGVNPYIQYIIRGLIIVLAVSIDVRKYIVKK